MDDDALMQMPFRDNLPPQMPAEGAVGLHVDKMLTARLDVVEVISKAARTPRCPESDLEAREAI